MSEEIPIVEEWRYIKAKAENKKLKDEVVKLNNIINELEESTEAGYYKYNSNDSDYVDGYNDGASQTAEFFHNMIIELKDSDKE